MPMTSSSANVYSVALDLLTCDIHTKVGLLCSSHVQITVRSVSQAHALHVYNSR
jgi:hypothetical protein